MNGEDNRRRYGIDWARHALVWRYPETIDAVGEALQRLAPQPLDPATLFIAAHVVYGLQRNAAGRRGLSLLTEWLSPGFGGRDVYELIRATFAWSTENEAARKAAISNIAELAREVERAVAHTRFADDGAAELAELRFELAEQKRGRRPWSGLIDWLPALPGLPAAKLLRRACRSFSRNYPARIGGGMCDEPLTTARKARAARHLRGEKQ